MSVDELRIRAEGIAIVHERTQMVWTRGDNLIHGLTQLGLLIDSLFLLFLLFRREEVDIIYISSVSRIIGEHRERERERERREIITRIY